MRLIFEYHKDIVPFDYSSKDNFISYLNCKYDVDFWKINKDCRVLGILVSKDDFEKIKTNVSTLDDWFSDNKAIIQY